MKRILACTAALILLGAFAASCRAVAVRTLSPPSTEAPPVPPVFRDRPMTVLVRGWLWDATTRNRAAGPVRIFPKKVKGLLEDDHGMSTEFFDYAWSRLPRDVFEESERFNTWARELTRRAERSGTCVNFLGHSAGAAFVYRAATQGVSMGYMGTLGLPTFGAERPSNVAVWANFYTSTHADDAAGWLWARQMAADVNVDLEERHRSFWHSDEVIDRTAEGIARSWDTCRS